MPSLIWTTPFDSIRTRFLVPITAAPFTSKRAIMTGLKRTLIRRFDLSLPMRRPTSRSQIYAKKGDDVKSKADRQKAFELDASVDKSRDQEK